MEDTGQRTRLVPRELRYQSLRPGGSVTMAGAVGEVESVRVDFRHPDLAAGEWEARPWWVVWTLPDSAGFIFPYEANQVDHYLRLVPAAAHLPQVFAEPGDTITIEAVDCEDIAGPFDHPHDVKRKLARLRLTKATGEAISSPNLTPFYGVTQLRDAPPLEAYDRLAERVLADHGFPEAIDALPGMIVNHLADPASVPDLRERALLCVGEAEKALRQLRGKFELQTDQGRASWRLVQRAVAAAALGGFSQGKAELRKAEKQAAGSAEGRAQGPLSLRNQQWWDYATAAWEAEPSRTAYSIKEGLIAERIAEESQESSIFRQLKKHPLNPKKRA